MWELNEYYTAPYEGRSRPKCGRCSFIIFSSPDPSAEWHSESMTSFKSDLRGQECRRMRQFAAKATESSQLREGHKSFGTKSIKVMPGFKYDITHRNKRYFSQVQFGPLMCILYPRRFLWCAISLQKERFLNVQYAHQGSLRSNYVF